jgi:hypothetical protein
MTNELAQWTGWPLGGVRRIPMLEGTTSAYRQFFLSSILISCSFHSVVAVLGMARAT